MKPIIHHQGSRRDRKAAPHRFFEARPDAHSRISEPVSCVHDYSLSVDQMKLGGERARLPRHRLLLLLYRTCQVFRREIRENMRAVS